MKVTIVLLGGDGVGPEVVREARKVLEAVAAARGHELAFTEHLIGGAAIDATGEPLPGATIGACKTADAVLLGAVGGPKWDDPKAKVRPEQGLLALRKALGVYANLRPVWTVPALMRSSALKPEVLEGVDLVVIRELTGGLYFGQPSERRDTGHGREAIDTCFYTEGEIARLVRAGFVLARQRRKKVTSVDKANVMSTSRLWREVASEVAQEFPDVQFENVLVDAMAMHLIRRPRDFDVIVTENLFGDILTDEASMLAGSMGMLPSASLAGAPDPATQCRGLYEPIHGSAPDIAGQDKANPLATILSLAMMFRYTFERADVADRIEAAVRAVLRDGLRTPDIARPGEPVVGTRAMGAAVRAALS